jgi:serine/threonine-protein kinase
MAEIPKTIGRYDIIEMVGRGGMGVLYRARDPTLERDVALKMMLVDFTMDQSARERFQREAKAVARLQHRNVVTIHELGEHDGAPYIVMEFLSGSDLENLLVGDKPMPLADKLDVAIQLCEGLGYAHEQGIVHRDIKPSNVRVLEDGTVKILDFGIAKFAVSTVTQSGTIMGTASYMSPEQIMGQPVDGRADLFSAGVLLFELLAGKKPFQGEQATAVVYQIMHTEPPTVRSVVPDLPEALDEIVSRALQKKADDRYSRASEMASDLQMVKMMLDLPLNSGEGASAAGGAAATPSLGSAKLYATSIGMKKPSTAVLHTPMRASAEAAAADAAPRAAHGANRSGLIWVGAALAVVALGLGGMYFMRGGESVVPPANAGVSAPAGPVTPAPPPAQTTTPPKTPATAPPKGAQADAAPPAARNGARQAAGGVAAGDLLAVSSSPSGARITLNGVDTGKVTPQALSLNGKQPNTIQLSKQGYQPLSATITAADVQTGSREFALTRQSGPVQLTVNGAFPFDLLQGEKVLGTSQTRHEVTVEPGGGVVTARAKDYLLNYTVPVDYQRAQADITLPGPGKLTVLSAVETCTVAVDGQDLGAVPIPSKSIASGAHSVTLKCADGRTETQKVTVVTGDKATVTFGKPKGH